MDKPYDWFAPLPDLTASFKASADRYWAKQPRWKRRLRPQFEAWWRWNLVGRLRWAFRWPRNQPEPHNWCTTHEINHQHPRSPDANP